MKARFISIVLCVCVLIAVFFLIRHSLSPATVSPGESKETLTDGALQGEETPRSRSYVIKVAHDTENLLTRLAFEEDKEYRESLPNLVERLKNSSAYLKDEIADYYGATYFSKLSEHFASVLSTPFSSNADFSVRVGKMLADIDAAYPSQIAVNENDPENPMYYPVLDTDVNGTVSLAMLSIYRQQQLQSGQITITLGGNIVLGDTILGAESDSGFKASVNKNPYCYPLYKISSVLATDTLSIANLEAPLTDTTAANTVAGAVKGIPSYADLLKKGGIDIVSIANDRIASFGEEGKKDTIDSLGKSGVQYSGEGAVAIFPTEIGSVAVLTYNLIGDSATDTQKAYTDAPKNDIAAAKADGAKFVIVHFNWQNASARAWDPSMSQVLTTRSAVDSGACLVFGTHPSAIEGIEQYNGVSIVYSPGILTEFDAADQGSFLFSQNFSLDADGNALPGEITVLPISSATTPSSVPSLILDSEGAGSFAQTIRTASSTVRYGVGKKAAFGLEHLNLISITK